MATINPGDERIIRFVRYVPKHLAAPGAEAKAKEWIRANLPNSVDLDEAWLPYDKDAEAANERYRDTLNELAKCEFPRGKLKVLLAELRSEGDAAVEWRGGDGMDRYLAERKVEDAFYRRTREARHAARTLARHFTNSSNLAGWTAALAFLKGVEAIEVHDSSVDDNGQPLKALASPFLHWKPPPSAKDGEAEIAEYFVALMERLEHELGQAKPHGYHRRRHGPFLYPPDRDPPRSHQALLVNGLLFIAVRGARFASGAPRDTRTPGQPMPRPEEGDSHYGLAVAFVQDVTRAANVSDEGIAGSFGTAADRLRKLIERSPGMVCVGWNHKTDGSSGGLT